MDLQKLTISSSEADFDMLLNRSWSWFLGKPFQPLLMTAFGDWFLADDKGAVFLLDLLDGGLTQIAGSAIEFQRLLETEEKQDDWLLPGFIEAMIVAGRPRPRGKCYAYQVHPAIGGQLASSNLILLDIGVWQLICGQIHQQLRLLPPGSTVKQMECGPAGCIRLITD